MGLPTTTDEPRVHRYPWHGHFPDVVIHASESAVKQHPMYAAAKAGDYASALALVSEALSDAATATIARLAEGTAPILMSVHAEERDGLNAIPQVVAAVLAHRLGWSVDTTVVQSNIVNHTGADGFSRLARQALFDGRVMAGTYVLVDDFIGQGGTFANLRGHLMHQGASVLCATVLTGKPHSARLHQTAEDLAILRAKHGQLEVWWSQQFGFGFDCLTASETRYLIQTPTTERIRERVTAAWG